VAVQPLPLAIAGTVLISSSAVVMELAGSSASLTALGRCGFALPVLAVLVWVDRRRGAAPLPSRNRWLARLAGVFLAADLIVWSHAISDIGAGLGTVVPNLQVLILSLLGWLVLGERPRRSLLLASPVMLAGLALVGGLTGTHAYGADPAAGVAAGAVVAVLYSVYIFTLRQAMAAAGPARGVVTGAAAGADDGSAAKGVGSSPVAALFEATLGATVASLVLGLCLHDFRLGHAGPAQIWPALGWLALLAITSQVLGWLLITSSMSRLPAWMIGVVLLIQPAGSVTLGYLILNERPSLTQLAGVALMLVGVLAAVSGRPATAQPATAQPATAQPATAQPATVQHEDHPPGTGSVQGKVAIEVAVPGHDAQSAG
jgi:drug/metabolite transporter (DMT)-like permease